MSNKIEEATRILAHYFRQAGVDADPADMQAEMEAVVCLILDEARSNAEEVTEEEVQKLRGEFDEAEFVRRF